MAKSDLIGLQLSREAQALADASRANTRDRNRWPHLDGDGVYLEDQTLAPGITNLRHGLKRMPRGVLLMAPQCSTALTAPVQEIRGNRSKQIVQLSNTNANTVVASVWIF